MKSPRAFFFGLTTGTERYAFEATETLYNQSGLNTGNLAFSYGLSLLIAERLDVIGWHTAAAFHEDRDATGILALANQLGPHTEMDGFDESFQRLQFRLVGLGLGAQAHDLQHDIELSKGTLEWVRVIQDRAPTGAPNLGLRGEFTRRLLEKYGLAGRTTVLGCPSLFINPERDLGARIAERYALTGLGRVVVAAGHQEWDYLAPLENSLARLIDKTNGAYVCQSPLEMIQLGRAEFHHLAAEERERCRLYVHGALTMEAFDAWTRTRAFSFFSTPMWLEFLRRFDFVIGTRIHGVALGLQAGIPSMCITTDSRTEELCQTMKIPYVPAHEVGGGMDAENIRRRFQFNPATFDANRLQLARRHVDFLQTNGLAPSSHLRRLAGDAV